MYLGVVLSDVTQHFDMWLVYINNINTTTDNRISLQYSTEDLGAISMDMDGNKATFNLDGKHQLNHSTVYKSAKSTR